MNKFSDEKPFDFEERHKALNKNIEKNPEIDLNSLKKEEFDELNKYKNQMAGYKDKLAEGFFAEINPLNLPLEKLKEQLAGEVNELKIDLASFRNHPEKIKHLSDKEKSDLYEKYLGAISEKIDQIQLIEDFLSTKESDPFADAETDIRDKWNKIEKVDPRLN